MTVALAIGALLLVMGAVIGWLLNRLAGETAVARSAAEEAERLRDQLGRRVDLLDAANRCARALGSSLEIEEAFAAFIRELRGLVPFDRTAIVLADDGVARVIAAAGAGAETAFPRGSRRPVAGSLLSDVIEKRPGRLPAGHGRPAVSRRGCVRLARPSLPAGGAAAARRPQRGHDLARTRRARLVQRGRDRARLHPRPVHRQRGAEHPRVRGRARDRRGAPQALGFARRLRVARLTRATEPHGRSDRLGDNASRALARALAGPARVLPGADRARDEAPRGSRRGRPRHLPDRVGQLQLLVRGRRRRRADPRIRGARGERPGRGGDPPARGRAVTARARRPGTAAAGDHEPDRQRGQVLAGRSGGRRRGVRGERTDHRRGAGQRPRRRTRAPVAHLREVRPRQRRARQARDGPRALHRQVDRAGARRLAGGALGARRGRNLRARPARRV